MSTAKDLLDHAAKSGWVNRNLMAKLRNAEGYRGMPYEDSLGKPTIGVGCLLPITEDEAMLLAACRAADTKRELIAALARIGIDFDGLGLRSVKDAFVDMAFQLGVPRTMAFTKMWQAVKERRWDDAADEAMSSRWAAQTPKRAKAVADWLRDIG